MGPTLLSLIGLDNVNPMLGADLTQRDPNRALMQYADNFGYLQGDKLLVLEPAKAPREFRYRAAPVGQDETYEPVEPVDEALSGGAGARAMGQLGLPRGKIPSALISPMAPETGLILRKPAGRTLAHWRS